MIHVTEMAAEKINELLPHLEEMMQDGLVTLEDVRVLKYRASEKKPG